MPAAYSQCSIPVRKADNDTSLVRNIGWYFFFKKNSSRIVKAQLSKISTVFEIVPSRMYFTEMKNNIL